MFKTITEANLQSGEVTLALRLRNLQTDTSYDRSDLELMYNEASTGGPTRITTCTDSAGLLGGFQIFYGIFDPKAGPAHGNIMNGVTCVESSLYNKITQINLWKWAPEQYAGIQIVMADYTDASAEGKTIVAGMVDGARRQTLDFPVSGTGHDFFGFATKEDKDDRLTTVDIVTYN